MLKVADIISFPFSQELQLVAGAKGMNRVVTNVGIHNHEELDSIPAGFGAGDFILTPLYMCGDDPEKIHAYLCAFMEAGVAAIGIQNIFFHALPQETIDHINEKSVPVFLFPKAVLTEDLVVEIKNAIAKDNKYIEYETMLEEILQGRSTIQTQKLLLALIDPMERGEATVYYFYRLSKAAGEDIMENVKALDHEISDPLPQHEMKALKYRQGFFLFAAGPKRTAQRSPLKLIEEYGFDTDGYRIGAHHWSKDEKIGDALKKSMAASVVSRCEGQKQTVYDDMGIYKYLFPVRKDDPIYREYRQRVGKLADYDKKNHTNLLETAIAYIENGGELSKTAESMFQHVNTIRYRLKRISEIIGLQRGNGHDFYVELSFLIKAHKVLGLPEYKGFDGP